MRRQQPSQIETVALASSMASTAIPLGPDPLLLLASVAKSNKWLDFELYETYNTYEWYESYK